MVAPDQAKGIKPWLNDAAMEVVVNINKTRNNLETRYFYNMHLHLMILEYE